MEPEEGEVHEEAALCIAKAIYVSGIELSKAKEGSTNLMAKVPGLLKVNTSLLKELNGIGEAAIATLHTTTVCRAGVGVAATKIIPLFTT